MCVVVCVCVRDVRVYVVLRTTLYDMGMTAVLQFEGVF